MAGGMDLGTGGKSKKKPLDTTINLVPFIDLMAVTISFLIMTAVWIQIGRLQVSSNGTPTDPNQEPDKPKVELVLLVTDKELRLSAGGTAYDPIPISRDSKGKLDLSKLVSKVNEIKTQLPPDHNSIMIQPEDTVRYEDLVRIIDDCIGVGLPNVSVTAAMG
jgi:biopolymer transport protein ExbD